MEAVSAAAGNSGIRWRRGLSNVPVPPQHLVGVAAAVLLGRCGAVLRRPAAAPVRAAGLLLAGAGVLLAGSAWRAARPVLLAQPRALVVAGPYRHSRNPMYLAWLLLHAGVGIAAGSGWVVLSLPAAAFLMHRDILDEERRLLEAFGSEHANYAARTPRYLCRSTTQNHPLGRDG
ncbi:methyltransferase family protein [Paeniglutamicibacter sp. MACA_103]|uniref:methyltransferase family protein n=1 Tax=Paeniglutamicibacter sp. MACA_103 TaxID=3377337 RepID=UPI003895539B